MATNGNCRLPIADCRLNGGAVLLHDEFVRGGNISGRRIFGDAEDERVVQAAAHLDDCAAAGAAAENRDALGFAGGDVHFRRHLVGVADDDEGFARLPKNQRRAASARFARVQHGFVGGELFGGRGELEVEQVQGFWNFLFDGLQVQRRCPRGALPTFVIAMAGRYSLRRGW